jgi:hypothetical protein
MARRKADDKLKEQIARAILANAVEYIPGWIETLGKTGSPRKKGQQDVVSAQTRVQAARTGMDLVSKLLPDMGATGSGEELLRKLGQIEQDATPIAPPEVGDWSEDPELDGQEADMEGSL